MKDIKKLEILLDKISMMVAFIGDVADEDDPAWMAEHYSVVEEVYCKLDDLTRMSDIDEERFKESDIYLEMEFLKEARKNKGR